MKKRKNLVVGLLIMLSLLVTGFTFAYWASSINADSESVVGTVEIGTGEAITVEVVLGGQGGDTLDLVPTTVTPLAGQSNSIEISFTVKWSNNDLLDGIADAGVSVLIENIEVNDVVNPYSLISVVKKSGNPTTIGLGDTVTFYFVITMSEPVDIIEYDAVAGLPITFNLTFTVDPNA